jgi:hypothetical protein
MVLAGNALMLFLLIRCGLVALVLACFIVDLFPNLLITFHASAWYSGYGYAALAILTAIVLCASRTSLGGHPLLASSHLDD